MKYNILRLFRCPVIFPLFAGFSAHALAADATPATAPIS
jgi:hypothetical protein